MADRGQQLRPLSSSRELKDFQEGLVWQDIKNYIELWTEGSMKVLKESDDILEVKKAQGAIEAAGEFLLLPEYLMKLRIVNDLFDRKEDAAED